MFIRALLAAGCFCLLQAASAQAQTAGTNDSCTLRLDVQLIESHSFLPIPDATIYLEGGSDGYAGDANGNVVIPNLCAGIHVLHVQSPGTAVVHDTVLLSGNQRIRLKLPHQAQSLQGVTVTDARVQTILQTKQGLNKADIAANAGKSLGEMLRNINGLSVLSTGATIAKPVIHGLHSNRILMLNNGIRQEDQQWGSEHAPDIDPFLASNITVIKGAASVRYGTDAIGGVVLVEPAPLKHLPGISGDANLAAFSNNRMGVAEVALEGALKRRPQFAIRVQGSFKKGGNYHIPGYWVANTGVEEANYSATMSYRAVHHRAELFYSHFDTEIGIYKGSHTGSQGDLLNAISSPKPTVQAGFTYDIARPRQHVLHDLVKLKLSTDTRAGQVSLTYAYQHNYRQEYDIVRVEHGNAQLNLTLNTQTLNLNLEHRPGNRITGQAGIDGIYQQHYFLNGDRLFIPNYNSAGSGAYLIERWRKDKWTVETGLRYDYRWYEVFNNEGANQEVVRYAYSYNSVSGTAGVQYRADEKLTAGLTFANAWRAPQANELFSAGLHHGAARIELGDKDLKPERSYGLNADVDWKPDAKTSLELGVYSQYINDYIFLEPGADLLTIRGYFKTFHYRQTNAWLNGADLTVNRQWNTYLQSTFKASTVLGRNVSAKDWLILMPPDRLSLETKVKRSLSYAFSDCFVSANGQYVFSQQRIPGNFDTLDYPRPPAAYFLLEASVGSTLHLRKQSLYVSLSATNLLNKRYREYLDAFRYFLDRPGTDVVLRVRIPINQNQ